VNQLLTQEQFKGIADRVGLAILTWLIAKGYISAADGAQWLALFVGLAGAAYGWWANRDKALVQAAAAVPNTVVVTDHTLAAATPEPNIVSSDTTAVVSKAP